MARFQNAPLYNNKKESARPSSERDPKEHSPNLKSSMDELQPTANQGKQKIQYLNDVSKNSNTVSPNCTTSQPKGESAPPSTSSPLLETPSNDQKRISPQHTQDREKGNLSENIFKITRDPPKKQSPNRAQTMVRFQNGPLYDNKKESTRPNGTHDSK